MGFLSVCDIVVAAQDAMFALSEAVWDWFRPSSPLPSS